MVTLYGLFSQMFFELQTRATTPDKHFFSFLCAFNATGRESWSGNFSWFINDLNATSLPGVDIQV